MRFPAFYISKPYAKLIRNENLFKIGMITAIIIAVADK